VSIFRRTRTELRAPFMENAAIAGALIRGMRKTGIPADTLEDVELYLGGISEVGREELLTHLQKHVQDRVEAQAARDRDEIGPHLRRVSNRAMHWEVRPGGALVEVWEDDAEAAQAQQREQSVAATRQAAQDERADTAAERREYQAAQAEFLRSHLPPGVPSG
jgi:hypothetical protein